VSHIDTLKIYKELVNNGMSQQQAETHVSALETSCRGVYEWIKELKEDFVSQKWLNFIGSLIFLALSAIGTELWYLSKEISSMNVRIGYLEERIK
jgi:hypothetical protein